MTSINPEINALMDVEFILGLTPKPKISERLEPYPA